MKSLAIAIFLLVLIIIPWPTIAIHSIVTLAYVMGISYFLGKKYSPTAEIVFRFILGLLLLLSIIMISSTAFFYLGTISWLTLFIVSLIPLLALVIPYQAVTTNLKKTNWNWKLLFLPLVHLVTAAYIVFVYSQRATTEAVVSPWLILPSSIFVFYFLSCCLALIIMTRKNLPDWLKIITASIQVFISCSLVTILYPLGFGFDPFIHQATEKILLTSGTINPKPLYYIGYYGLVAWLATWTQLPLQFLDTWLLPLIGSLTLPGTIYYSFRCNFRSEPRALALLTLLILLIPYGFLIQTTPQGLSLLWSLLIIFLSLFYIHRQSLTPGILLLLALAALTLHPLSGIPLTLYVLLLSIYHRSWEIKKPLRWLRLTIYGLLATASAFALPLVFALQSRLSGSTSNSAINPSLWQMPHYYRFIRWEDFIYTIDSATKPLLFLSALFGLWYVIKQRRAHYFIHYLVMYFVLLGNFILLSLFVHFDFLIAYERTSYPERILTLSYFFLWPFSLITLYWLAKRLFQAPSIIRYLMLGLLAILLTVSWYLTYPRFDFYSQSKGYNTSSHDLAAVRWISNDAGSKPYIVLANQSVSAAAISLKGFEPYYHGQYNYPIPTGGQLYQSYLDAVYNRKEMDSIIQDVKTLTGVTQVYLVVDDYWSDFDNIIQRQKNLADTTTMIDNGQIYIFTYETQ